MGGRSKCMHGERLMSARLLIDSLLFFGRMRNGFIKTRRPGIYRRKEDAVKEKK
jgi:hypothetical protein